MAVVVNETAFPPQLRGRERLGLLRTQSNNFALAYLASNCRVFVVVFVVTCSTEGTLEVN